MDFEVKVKEICEKLKEICELSQEHGDDITTEATTITVLVLPFLQAFGYDTGNPSVYAREFEADAATKKDEKVDIALFKGKEQKKKKEPMVLIECKTYGTELQRKHTDQLFRYFSVTEAKIAVLTNGTEYQFYSDLRNRNKMDPEPFCKFDVCNFDCDQDHFKELVRLFSKEPLESSSPRQISERANKFNDTKKVKEILAAELTAPSESFVRFFVDQIYNGRKTSQVMEYFAEIVRKACEQFMQERVNERLERINQAASAMSVSDQQDSASETETEDDIVMKLENEAHEAVQDILRMDGVDTSRVTKRDAKRYCNILLDNKVNKQICQLEFKKPSRLKLGLFDAKQTGVKTPKIKHHLENGVKDIFKYADEIRQTRRDYDDQK